MALRTIFDKEQTRLQMIVIVIEAHLWLIMIILSSQREPNK